MAHSLNSCRHYLFALVYDEFNFLSSAPALKGETQKKNGLMSLEFFVFFLLFLYKMSSFSLRKMSLIYFARVP